MYDLPGDYHRFQEYREIAHEEAIDRAARAERLLAFMEQRLPHWLANLESAMQATAAFDRLTAAAVNAADECPF